MIKLLPSTQSIAAPIKGDFGMVWQWHWKHITAGNRGGAHVVLLGIVFNAHARGFSISGHISVYSPAHTTPLIVRFQTCSALFSSGPWQTSHSWEEINIEALTVKSSPQSRVEEKRPLYSTSLAVGRIYRKSSTVDPCTIRPNLQRQERSIRQWLCGTRAAN